MTPTRRKPTRRKDTKKGIDGTADALFVDGSRPEVDLPREEKVVDEVGENPPIGVDAAVAAGERRNLREEVPSPADNAAEGSFAPDFEEGAEASPAESEGPASFRVVRGRRSVKDEQDEANQGKRLFAALRVALIVILVVLVVVEGGFCLMRWAVDDSADMQGSWYVNGSQSTIVITGESIVLADDVAYEYHIDEWAKTITFTFGAMEGQGRYRFSLDRTQLAIMDGEFTFMDTLTDDIAWTFEALMAQIVGGPLAPGAGESVAALERAALAPGSDSGQPENDATTDANQVSPDGSSTTDEDDAADDAGNKDDASSEAPPSGGSKPSQGGIKFAEEVSDIGVSGDARTSSGE